MILSLGQAPQWSEGIQGVSQGISNMGAQFKRLTRLKSASSGGTSNAPSQGVQHCAQPRST
jgi:hypothetical protein